MSKHIDFYFDFASPYAYLSSIWIDEVAARHGATLNWKPFLLGAVFKEEGTRPLVDYPNKGAYSLKDMERTARMQGVPMTMPSPFPFLAVAASRAFYALVDEQPEQANALAKAVFAETFSSGTGVATPDQVLKIAAAQGLDTDALGEAMQRQEVKDRLRTETETAIKEHKIFGAPFFIVDGEGFWGNDKREQISRWLETGGW